MLLQFQGYFHISVAINWLFPELLLCLDLLYALGGLAFTRLFSVLASMMEKGIYCQSFCSSAPIPGGENE